MRRIFQLNPNTISWICMVIVYSILLYNNKLTWINQSNNVFKSTHNRWFKLCRTKILPKLKNISLFNFFPLSIPMFNRKIILLKYISIFKLCKIEFARFFFFIFLFTSTKLTINVCHYYYNIFSFFKSSKIELDRVFWTFDLFVQRLC